jgi:hypothetical protein
MLMTVMYFSLKQKRNTVQKYSSLHFVYLGTIKYRKQVRRFDYSSMFIPAKKCWPLKFADKKYFIFEIFKGIVSRDWGGLLKVSVDR